MTSVLHSVLHSHASTPDRGAAGLPCDALACPGPAGLVSAHGGGPGAAETPRGGSNGRPGPADEFEGPHHGRESKNLDPPNPACPALSAGKSGGVCATECCAVAALFVREDSHYKGMAGVDAWDVQRDARGWPGGCPVVAHPPCRAWGRMRDKAQPRPDEMELARQAVRWVRRFGGVLEHPAHSTLWPDMRLPMPRRGRDAWGGWTLPIAQNWFGYRAEKLTWLYVVGCEPGDVPDMPLDLRDPPRVVAQLKGRKGQRRPRKGDQGWRPEVTRTERERTPPALAAWLVELARRCDESVSLKWTRGAACA